MRERGPLSAADASLNVDQTWVSTSRAGDGDGFDQPTPLPFIPGSEVAGTVIGLGEGVTSPAMGTRVFGLTVAGYAELAVLDAVGAVPVPEALGADAAAGLLLVGVTASLIVQGAARIQAGETIFVPAASGSYDVGVSAEPGWTRRTRRTRLARSGPGRDPHH